MTPATRSTRCLDGARARRAAARRSSASATSPRAAFSVVPPHARRASGSASTVDYLHCGGPSARSPAALLPHTNAGLLDGDDDDAPASEVNVSLGLMLENVSPRLCEPGMPHHRAPDKRPDRRLAMIDEAGRLRIPFTTGILVGIGETRRERVESLLAIRAAPPRARPHPGGHRAELPRRRPACAMARAPEPDDDEVTARGRDGAPHPRRRRLAAGAAQPQPGVGRGAARRRSQRLRRHLAA